MTPGRPKRRGWCAIGGATRRVTLARVCNSPSTRLARHGQLSPSPGSLPTSREGFLSETASNLNLNAAESKTRMMLRRRGLCAQFRLFSGRALVCPRNTAAGGKDAAGAAHGMKGTISILPPEAPAALGAHFAPMGCWDEVITAARICLRHQLVSWSATWPGFR